MEVVKNDTQKMDTKFDKIEIPAEPQISEADKQMAELMKLSITEEKKMIPLDKFKFTVDLFTNSAFYIVLKIQDEPEVKNNDWHFIPYNIPEDQQKENENKTQWMQFFCVEDEKILKRFTKKIKKYFAYSQVDWQPFDATKYKNLTKSI